MVHQTPGLFRFLVILFCSEEPLQNGLSSASVRVGPTMLWQVRNESLGISVNLVLMCGWLKQWAGPMAETQL